MLRDVPKSATTTLYDVFSNVFSLSRMRNDEFSLHLIVFSGEDTDVNGSFLPNEDVLRLKICAIHSKYRKRKEIDLFSKKKKKKKKKKR